MLPRIFMFKKICKGNYYLFALIDYIHVSKIIPKILFSQNKNLSYIFRLKICFQGVVGEIKSMRGGGCTPLQQRCQIINNGHKGLACEILFKAAISYTQYLHWVLNHSRDIFNLDPEKGTRKVSKIIIHPEYVHQKVQLIYCNALEK